RRRTWCGTLFRRRRIERLRMLVTAMTRAARNRIVHLRLDFLDVVGVDRARHPNHRPRIFFLWLRIRCEIELRSAVGARRSGGVTEIAARAEGAREAAHRGEQLIV